MVWYSKSLDLRDSWNNLMSKYDKIITWLYSIYIQSMIFIVLIHCVVKL